MKNNDRISIIIIVKNDKGIEKTLSGLSSQKKPTKTEVVVVDASEGELNYLHSKYSSVIWIPYATPTIKKYTIPEQRNFGIASASGNIIVFIDASCEPSENWLSKLYDRYLEGEKIVAGVIKSTEKNILNNISARRQHGSNYVEECPTASLLLSKEVVDAVGPFDEAFEYGSDTDYTWRARDLGYRILLEESAIIYHDWGDTKQQLKRSFYYGKGRMQLYMKHSKRIHDMLKNDPILFFYPIFIFFMPIAIFYPEYLLLLIIPIIKNYKSRPFSTLVLNGIYGFGGLNFLLSRLISKLNLP